MRAFRLSVLVLLIAAVGGFALLALTRRPPQSLVLPDGSQLTLLQVTSGKNQICRYGHGWKEFLYPLLPLKLRVRLAARALEWDAFRPDSVMVWFRRDAMPSSGAPRICLSVADEPGLESPLQTVAHTTRTLGAMRGSAIPGTTVTEISGWELADHPARSRQLRILIRTRTADGSFTRVGEFRVPNPLRQRFPVWTAESLPATRRAIQLEATLARLETGITGAHAFGRATFKLTENGAPTENWSPTQIQASAATGATRYGDERSIQWLDGKLIADLWGGLWLEEPAWKVEADFARASDFPREDLWGVKGVPAPLPGETVNRRVETNLHAVTLEFVGISGLKTERSQVPFPRQYGVIQVRAPHPLNGLHIVLVEARDDRGRAAVPHGLTRTISTGSGGNTPKESLTGFRVEIPPGAKALDITLAVTPILRVEFLAKPVMLASPKAAD